MLQVEKCDLFCVSFFLAQQVATRSSSLVQRQVKPRSLLAYLPLVFLNNKLTAIQFLHRMHLSYTGFRWKRLKKHQATENCCILVHLSYAGFTGKGIKLCRIGQFLVLITDAKWKQNKTVKMGLRSHFCGKSRNLADAGWSLGVVFHHVNTYKTAKNEKLSTPQISTLNVPAVHDEKHQQHPIVFHLLRDH